MPVKHIDQRNKAFAHEVGGHLTAEQMAKQTFAERVGVRRQTLARWLIDPSPMTLGAFRVIVKDTRMSDEAVLAIIKGGR